MATPQRDWAGLITTENTDLPRRVQEAINTMAYRALLAYADSDERDDTWADPELAGYPRPVVCTLDEQPGALFVRNPDSGLWAEFSPRPEVAQGTCLFSWPAGSVAASLPLTKAFPVPFSQPPLRIDFSRESAGVESITVFNVYVVAGSITTTGFQAVCVTSNPLAGAYTRSLTYEAVRWN